MFATLRTSHNSLRVERASPNASFSACNACRLKKLKCTGELSGCRRCLLHHSKCTYPGTTTRRRSTSLKGSKQRRRSNEALLSPPSSIDSAQNKTAQSDALSSASNNSYNSGTQQTPVQETTAGVEHNACSTDNGKLGSAGVTHPTHELWNAELFSGFDDDVVFGNDTLDAFLETSSDINEPLSIEGFCMEDLQSGQFPTAIDVESELACPSVPPQINLRVPPTSSPLPPRQAQLDTRDADVLHLQLQPDETEATPKTTHCQCMSIAVSLLEALALDQYDTGSISIGQVLRRRKRALTTCNTLLDCQVCSKASPFLMLMIQICEKAVQSYTKLADQPSSPVSTADELSFGEYDASSEEMSLVFGSLAAFHLEKWKRLLGQLSHRCKLLGLMRHMTMAVDLDRCVRMQIVGFRMSD